MTAVFLLLGLLAVIWIAGGAYSAREGMRDRYAAQRNLRAAYVRAGKTPPDYL